MRDANKNDNTTKDATDKPTEDTSCDKKEVISKELKSTNSSSEPAPQQKSPAADQKESKPSQGEDSSSDKEDSPDNLDKKEGSEDKKSSIKKRFCKKEKSEEKNSENEKPEEEHSDESNSEEDVSEEVTEDVSEDTSEEAVDLDSPLFSKLHIVLMALVGCLLAGTIAVVIACAVWLQGLPDYSDADSFNTIKPTEVYASDHKTLLARFQLENRDPLDSIDSISKYAVEGTVATEDERFYNHGGVDLIGMGRAVMNNVFGGTLEGASTITQQLVRNTILLDEMDDITYKRKVREAYLAMEMEKLYSKDDILLLYMNTINYGGGAYGIEAAAKRYYSKSASELTLSEAAMLVGIPQSPAYNNPLYYPDNALERRNTVLDRMVSYGAITNEEAEAAKAEPINLNPTEPSVDGFVAYPYFASYVRDQLLNSDTYNLSATEIFKGGLTVYTTLDVDMQDMADAAAQKAENQMSSALSVGLTAVDPNTGYIKAMVGGDDFYESQWNLASQEARQPGSSFKTFTLVTALEQGISPETSVNCSSSVTIGSNPSIENINGTEYGTRSIASAFAVSSNTGFARLCEAVTPQAVSDTAHKMGITSYLDPVLSLTLGTSDVTTLEMADAYATIANGGTHYDAIAVEQILDRKDKVIFDATNPQGKQALSPEVACAARKVMEGVINGGTGTAARIDTGQPVAGKTGTSENYMDSYFAGFTPELSVAIWIGDPNRVVPATTLTGANVFGYFMNDWCQDREIVPFMEADDPAYTKTFSNANLDISNVSSVKKETEAEKQAREEAAAQEAAQEAQAAQAQADAAAKAKADAAAQQKAAQEAQKKAEQEAQQKENQSKKDTTPTTKPDSGSSSGSGGSSSGSGTNSGSKN